MVLLSENIMLCSGSCVCNPVQRAMWFSNQRAGFVTICYSHTILLSSLLLEFSLNFYCMYTVKCRQKNYMS